jgi:TrmH family RNA methyltransferase
MSTILGAHSPKLDALRALRTKSGRAERGRYAVEGPTLLAEALAAGLVPESVFATEDGAATLAGLGAAARRLDDRTFTIPDRAMARVSDLETPPGIVAVFPIVLDEPAALFDGTPVLMLAGLGDPGNAGTLLRAAEIFGITRAVFTADAVEPHNPKVVRATMGALFRMRLARATGAALVAAAAHANYTIVAASREGEPLPEFRFPERVALAIGNERHGVAGSLPGWDRSLAIPQRGGGESLNAAVAGGIIFYAFSQAADVSQTLENP